MNDLIDALLFLPPPVIYAAILLILLFCGLGLPIPEDLTLFAAGLISFYGATDIHLMIGIAFVGILLGDSLIYFLGAHYGRKITQKVFFRRILSAEKLASVQKRFHHHGPKILFLARFMPGLRAPIYFTAGTLHLPYRKFICFDGAAALISVPVLTYLAYHFGDTVDSFITLITGIKHSMLYVLLALAAVVLLHWLWSSSRRKSASEAP